MSLLSMLLLPAVAVVKEYKTARRSIALEVSSGTSVIVVPMNTVIHSPESVDFGRSDTITLNVEFGALQVFEIDSQGVRSPVPLSDHDQTMYNQWIKASMQRGEIQMALDLSGFEVVPEGANPLSEAGQAIWSIHPTENSEGIANGRIRPLTRSIQAPPGNSSSSIQLAWSESTELAVSTTVETPWLGRLGWMGLIGLTAVICALLAFARWLVKVVVNRFFKDPRRITGFGKP